MINLPQRSFSLFLVIWTGQLLSRIGSGISAFALGVYLFHKTGSTAAYSFLLLSAFLPSVILAPVGGVIADRKDRKLMMIAGDLGSALGILFIIVMFLFFQERNWFIYSGVIMSSLFVALHSPAFKASVTDILEEGQYSRASGLIQLAEASRYIFAPVIAAFLIKRFSFPIVLAIDVITFLFGALTVSLIWKKKIKRGRGKAHESFWADLTAGVKYLTGNRIIFNLLCLTSVVTFCTGILQSLFVPLILSFTDSTVLGSIQSIAALGMLISSLLIGILSKTEDQKRVLFLSLAAGGFFYILIGTNTNVFLITFTAFCFFFTLPFVNTSLEVLFRKSIEKNLQGRIWSLISLITQAGMLIAFGVAGVLADRIFNPLLVYDGLLADTFGKIIGIGPGRGNGLMIILSGSLLLLFSLLAARKFRADQ